MDFVDDGYTTLDYTPLVESYYKDLNNMVEILGKLCGSYNLLTITADALNRNSFAKKDDVEDAIKRVKDLGRVIDRITDCLKEQIDICIGYTKTKNEFIGSSLPFNDILKSHIDHFIKIEHHKLFDDDDKHDKKDKKSD